MLRTACVCGHTGGHILIMRLAAEYDIKFSVFNDFSRYSLLAITTEVLTTTLQNPQFLGPNGGLHAVAGLKF